MSWYACVRNKDFGIYCLKKDPYVLKSTEDMLKVFLSEVGTVRLASSRDVKQGKYPDDVFYSYLQVPVGASVTYCLDFKTYFHRLVESTR